jgi:methyl-accepting chemotaxis protein
MDRELNLPLTARESAFVKAALIRWRDEEKRCVRAMKASNVVSNVSDYERDVKDIENILNKIERMADGTR